MKDSQIRFKLEKWHYYLLGLVLINFGIGLITSYKLNQNVTLILKTILYLTGVLLFFKSLKPIKLMTAYYSFYLISAVLTGLFYLFGGIFLAIVSSIILYPIYPKQIVYKTETIKMYDRFQGFMSRCCSYEVVEPKLYIFEKHLGYINIGKPIDGAKDVFTLKSNSIIYKYELETYRYDNQTKKMRDTTEILNFE